jgi:hypothetical protein
VEVCPVKQVQYIVAISPFLPHQLAFTHEASSDCQVSIRCHGYALVDKRLVVCNVSTMVNGLYSISIHSNTHINFSASLSFLLSLLRKGFSMSIVVKGSFRKDTFTQFALEVIVVLNLLAQSGIGLVHSINGDIKI